MSILQEFLTKFKEIVKQLNLPNDEIKSFNQVGEVYAVACIKNNKLYIVYTVGSITEVPADKVRKVWEKCIHEIGGEVVAEAHTHPAGFAIPSDTDVYTYSQVVKNNSKIGHSCVCRLNKDLSMTCTCLSRNISQELARDIARISKTIDLFFKNKFPVEEQVAKTIEDYFSKVFKNIDEVKVLTV